jgi:hypothetical protein
VHDLEWLKNPATMVLNAWGCTPDCAFCGGLRSGYPITCRRRRPPTVPAHLASRQRLVEDKSADHPRADGVARIADLDSLSSRVLPSLRALPCYKGPTARRRRPVGPLTGTFGTFGPRRVPSTADRLLRIGADLIDRSDRRLAQRRSAARRLSEIPPPHLTNLSLAGTAQVDRGHVPEGAT